MSATPSTIMAVRLFKELSEDMMCKQRLLTIARKDKSKKCDQRQAQNRSPSSASSLRNTGVEKEHLSCVPPWCCCGIAPMVTDDATFHGLSLQLHPQSGLGIFTRITIFFVF